MSLRTPPKPMYVGDIVFVALMIHVSIWAVICFFLFLINLCTTLLLPPWFIFPTLCWGIGIALHTVATYFLCEFFPGPSFVECVNDNVLIPYRRFQFGEGGKKD